jgi:cytoskeletal protein CcmA (bactofilin family)
MSLIHKGNYMERFIDDQSGAQAETVVGPSVRIQGDLNSEGNIRIEGHVTGKVKTSQSVYVGQAAIITADVVAGNAVIGGEIQGNLKISGHLVLQSSAKINGDIHCSIFRVEDGAQFTGKCTMNGGTNGKKSVAEPEAE